MAALVKSFAAVLILNLATGGFCGCSLGDLTIGTVRSGKEIQGMAEWTVTITNNCICAQSRIILYCGGFQTVEHVNPAILNKQGDGCVFVHGTSLPPSASVTFSYAWDTPFILLPKSSIIAGC